MTSGSEVDEAFWQLAASGSTRAAIAHVLELAAAGETVDRMIRGTLVPTQEQVGALWEADEWTIADEHVATAVVDGVLGALGLQTVVPTPPRGSVLVACVEGEHHTLPARMGVERLRADGWEVTFLGGSVGTQDLQRAVVVAEPGVVVLSCTVPLFLPGAGRCIGAVAELGVPVVAAGAGFGETSIIAERLGASGWITRDTDVDGTLERARPAAPPTRDLHPEAMALELRDADIRERCLAELRQRIPAMRTFSAEQIAHTRADLDSILDHVAVALEMDEAALFADFVAWLTRVLQARGLPPSVLDTSLDTLAVVLRRTVLPEAARLCQHDRPPSVR